MSTFTQRTGRMLGIGVVFLLLLAMGGGYFMGRQSVTTDTPEAVSVWEIASAVVARRSITVKGEVQSILTQSIMLQAQNSGTGKMDQLAVPVEGGTQAYLTIRRDGKSEAPALISLGQIEVGDKADAVIDIDVNGKQTTTSLAIWRDL